MNWIKEVPHANSVKSHHEACRNRDKDLRIFSIFKIESSGQRGSTLIALREGDI